MDGSYLGYITLEDTVRKEAKETLRRLQNQKVYTMMLTGDHKQAVSKLASEVGG